MDSSYTMTTGYFVFKMFIYACCALLIFGITIWHVYASWHLFPCSSKFSPEGQSRLRVKKLDYNILIFGTVASMIFFLIYVVSVLFENFLAGNDLECEVRGRTSLLSYVLGKHFLYLVMASRLELGFGSTAWGYKSRTIRLLYGCIFFTALLSIIGMSFSVNVNVTTEAGEQTCDPNIEYWVFAVLLLSDFIYSISLMGMFISSLKRMLRFMEGKVGSTSEAQSPNEKNMQETQTLPFKYALVGGVALVSTFISLIASAVALYVGVAVDCVINSLCLCFLYNTWERQYNWCCGPAMQCLGITSRLNSGPFMRRVASPTGATATSKKMTFEVESDAATNSRANTGTSGGNTSES